MTRNRVTGADALDRQLAALAKGVSPTEVRAALRAGGEVIASEARRLAPVDTGRLRDSIEVSDARDADLYGRPELEGVSVVVGPVGSTEEGDVFYARFQEFGTARHEAQPFMRPAIASKRDEAGAAVAAALSKAIGKQIR